MNLSQSIDKFAYSLLEKFFEIGCVSHQDGYTIIEKATFRPAAFDTLDLPCAIREGYIETIKYRLDIDNLKADRPTKPNRTEIQEKFSPPYNLRVIT